jgi:PAS domain S-box-containing protein
MDNEQAAIKGSTISLKAAFAAFFLGIMSIVLALTLGKSAFNISTNEFEEQYRSIYLQEAKTLAEMARLDKSSSPEELLVNIQRMYEMGGTKPADEYLCVVDIHSNLLIHTAHPDMVGNNAGENQIFGEKDFPEKCLADLIQSGRDYAGDYVSSSGESQLAAFASIPHKNWVLGIHRSKAALKKHIEQGLRFSKTGFYIICGLVMPISWILIYLTFYFANKRRQKAEEALAASENKWHQVLVNTPQIAISLNRDYKIVFANEQFQKLTGWKKKKIIGCDWFDTFTPENVRKNLRDVLAAAIDGKDTSKFSNFENDILTKTGELRRVAWSNVLTRDPAGNVSEITCLGLDITERKKTEESLRQSEKDLMESQRIAHLGSWRLDTATNQVEWTEELYRMYGFDPTLQPPIYTEHMKLFTPESWERLSKAVTMTCETKTPYELELETVRSDGSNGWMWVRGETVIDAAGKTVGLCGTAQDITDSKRVEQEKKELEERLHHAQKIEAIGRLAGGVAHDFNNTLSVIIGYADMALEEIDPASSLYEPLEEIRKAGKHSAALTAQLLAFARRQPISPKILDLNTTVTGMIKMLHHLIGEDIVLTCIPDKDAQFVKMDPSQINQILANLCLNARAAITDVGKITIEISMVEIDEAYCADHSEFTPGQYVVLAVTDDGCGMNADILENIFEPFFTTRETGKGTGLGLATVYGIVKQNECFVNVDSEENLGTTFKIYLPRHQGEVETLRKQPESSPREQGMETILLVEDEQAILKVTRKMLESLGYRVLPASTADEAINLARLHGDEINLLMTDVIMPEINGRELAKSILTILPNLRRLFMSGYTANVIAHRGVLDRGVNFIQKPFLKADLAMKIREVLDTSF